MVGNRNVVDYRQFCPWVTLFIHGQLFEVDLHLLPINGSYIVLGVQWLKQLGPIITDYSQLTMQFTRDDLVQFRVDD